MGAAWSSVRVRPRPPPVPSCPVLDRSEAIVGGAALILWLVTALVGAYLAGVWLVKDGARPRPVGAGSRFPPAVISGHVLLATVGWGVWIGYLVTGSAAVGWAAFGIVAVVAVLGVTMLARWIPTYRARRAGPPAGAGGPAERHFSVTTVAGHGVLAAGTLVLVLLTALGVAGG